MSVWDFKPVDSCFFRGAKSFNSGEGGFLDSQFPPTAQTLAGVIRAAIGDAKGVNWQKFRDNQESEVAQLIGKDTDDAGKLSFAGPFILQEGKRLYPAPLFLMHSETSKGWTILVPSQETFKTDMGEKRLPTPKPPLEGGKPLENVWLDADNMQRVLAGEAPNALIKEHELFDSEARVGIGRDNQKRKTEDGLLYFTRHVRMRENVSLGMAVTGADDVKPASMVRLGGEGRMAKLSLEHSLPSLAKVKADAGDKFVIILLTHADFSEQKFEPTIEGVTIVSACIGKAVREGGWDYKHNRPKPLKSLVPAGSCYFVEGDEAKIRALHGTYIGERTAFGYGEVAVGIWREGK